MSAQNLSRNGQVLRALGWALFAVLTLAWTAVQTLEAPSDFEASLASSLVYLLPILLTAFSAWALTLNTRGAEMRFWAYLAAASTLLFVSETYWAWYVSSVNPRGPQLPAPFEILQAFAALLFMTMFISMTSLGRSRVITRVRVYLDAFAAMIVAWAVLYLLWTVPLFEGAAQGGWKVASIAAAYPVLGAVLVLVSVTIFFGWKSKQWRSWERFVAASFVIYGAGLCAFPVWYAKLLVAQNVFERSWLTVVLGFGYYLLFMAIVYRATSTSSVEVEQWPMLRSRANWSSAVFPFVAALALPFMGWAALVNEGTPAGPPVAMATFSLAAVLIVRSWFSALERAHRRELAITDPVSGAYNHRFLYESLFDDLLRAVTLGQELGIVLVDIDNFKSFNSAHGHQAGDELLRRIAEMVQSGLGQAAKVFRFGSDEFVAIIPGIDADRALELTRHVHLSVARGLSLAGTSVSLSSGIAIFPEHGSDGEQLLSRALAAQQVAKVAGADDVFVYDERIVGAMDPHERLQRAKRRSRRATVSALAAAVDARDSDTRNHSENVAELVSALAQMLGVSEQQRRTVELAARLHDIGKIGVSDEVLLKSGPLAPSDRAQIEEHPSLGERILAPAGLDEILPTVRHHHEHWDGSGYPDGLRGPQIPLEARLLSVCDAFEAMTAGRSYREARSVSDALMEIEAHAGTQFDPDVAAAFARMITHLHGYAARDKAERLGQGPVVADEWKRSAPGANCAN